MQCHLLRLPDDILELVASLVADDPAFPALLRVCKAVHARLLGNPHLLANLFYANFDTAAPHRRLFAHELCIPAAALADEFRSRTAVLKEIGAFIRTYEADREVDPVWPPHMEHLAWTVFFMLVEDDGANMPHLLRVNVNRWADLWLLDYFIRDLDPDGWPVETTLAALMMFVLAGTEDPVSVMREDHYDIEALLSQIHPIVVGSHRYPVSLFPDAYWDTDFSSPPRPVVPQLLSQNRVPRIHTPVPPSHVAHFGRLLCLRAPPLAQSALLVFQLRNDALGINTDEPHLVRDHDDALARGMPGRGPLTRADLRRESWIALAARGTVVPHAAAPTRTHYLDFLNGAQGHAVPWVEHEPAAVRIGERVTVRGSERWDPDFWRLVCAADPGQRRSFLRDTYVPGMLTGNWEGRFGTFDLQYFMALSRLHPLSPSDVKRVVPDDHFWPDTANVHFQASVQEHIRPASLPHAGLPRADLHSGWIDRDAVIASDPWRASPGVSLRSPHLPGPVPYDTFHPSPANGDEDELRPPARTPPRMFRALSPTDWAQLAGGHTTLADLELEQLHVEVSAKRRPTLWGAPGAEDMGPDILLTGGTSEVFSRSYGAFVFQGRIRPADGLITLLRKPLAEPGLGTWVFRGYLRASSTIVGRWRVSGGDVDEFGYEGPWVVSREDRIAGY